MPLSVPIYYPIYDIIRSMARHFPIIDSIPGIGYITHLPGVPPRVRTLACGVQTSLVEHGCGNPGIGIGSHSHEKEMNR